jgi:hypothetical protein
MHVLCAVLFCYVTCARYSVVLYSIFRVCVCRSCICLFEILTTSEYLLLLNTSYFSLVHALSTFKCIIRQNHIRVLFMECSGFFFLESDIELNHCWTTLTLKAEKSKLSVFSKRIVLEHLETLYLTF